MSFHFLEKKGVCSLFCLFMIVVLATTQVCCFSIVSNRVGRPEVSSDITAATVLSNMNCTGLYCHPDRSYLTRDHLFGPLKQQLGGSRFHCNEEVEMAVCE